MGRFLWTRARRRAVAMMLAFAIGMVAPPALQWSGGGGVAIAATSTDEATARFRAWMTSTRSLRADFIQSVFDEEGIRIEETRGTMALHRPYRFRWDYSAPEPQLIVADGTTLWWYDVELAQATARPLESTLRGTPALLLAGPIDQPLDEEFEFRALPDGEDGLAWFELTPRADGSSFRTLRFGLEGDELRRFETEDALARTTRIEFSQVEYDPPLDETLFRFDPPAGVDVVRAQ